MPEPLLLGKGERELFLLPALANRHGLIAGATGTGKTVTLQRLAEGFSAIGVPVFMADVKGDLSGISQAGKPTPRIEERLRQMAIGEFAWRGCPVASGTCSAARACRCARPSRRWGRCSWRACST